MPPPTFLYLRRVSIHWENSLAFWLHAQRLLACAPIETFHIIRWSTIGENNRGPFNDTASEPWGTVLSPVSSRSTLPFPFVHAFLSVHDTVDDAIVSLNDVDSRFTDHTRNLRGTTSSLFDVLVRLGLRFPRREAASEESNHSLDPFVVDDNFVQRFAALHDTTLRQFWVIGMRCSDTAIKDLCKRCEKLERVRADDVDEYPVRTEKQKPTWSHVY